MAGWAGQYFLVERRSISGTKCHQNLNPIFKFLNEIKNDALSCLEGPTMIVHTSSGLMQLDVPRPVIAHQSSVWARYCRSTSRGEEWVTSFQAAICKTTLHKTWSNAVVLHEYMHQWYCSNGIQFTLVAMMRCINKAYRNSSYNANFHWNKAGHVNPASTATRQDKEVLRLLYN